MNFNKTYTTTIAVIGSFLLTSAYAADLRHVFDDPFFETLLSKGSFFEKDIGVNCYEKDNKFHVEAPLPGVKESDIILTLEQHVLYIEGQRKSHVDDENVKNYYSTSNSFKYRVSLPEGADLDKPQATFENGLMTVVFNKKASAEPRKIEFSHKV